MAHLERLTGLSLAPLYLTLEASHVLQVGPAKNLDVLAKQIRERSTRSGIALGSELSRSSLHDAINKVEVALNLKLFERATSGPSGWHFFRDKSKKAQAQYIFDHIEGIVEKFHQLESVTERFTISIGCSRTLGSSLVPNVCEQVKEKIIKQANETGEQLEFDILFSHDMPQVVRNQGMGLGSFDLVVASCHLESRDDRKIEGHVSLPMRLMLNRRDPLSWQIEVKWEDLNGYTLLLQPKILNPQPAYPFDHFPPGLFYKRVESYAEAFAAVRAAGSTGKMACLAFPHAHSPAQRSGLRAYELPGMRKKIPVGVIRPTKAIDRTDEKKAKVVEALTEAIVERLKTIESESKKDQFKNFFANQPLTTFSVTRKPTKGKSHHWLRGELRNLAVFSDGYFEGDHVVFDKFHKDQPIEYSIAGHINLEHGRYQLSWRGTKLKGDHVPAEDYCANLVLQDPSMPWLGCWLGKSIWDKNPDVGYFFVQNGTPVEVLTADDEEELGTVIDRYYLENAELPQLPLNIPGQVKAALSAESPEVRISLERAR